jgi:hypothetical protein
VKNKSSITGKGLSSYVWKDCIKLRSSAEHGLSPIGQPTNKYKNMSLLPPSQTQTFRQHDSPQSTRSSHYGFKPQTAIKTSFPTPNYIMPLLANVHTMTLLRWAGIAQSVLQLARGRTVRGSNPGGGEIFHTHPDRPWGPPSLI